MFRGQADAAWPLIPKAGRPPYSERNDLDYLEAWKRRAAEFLPRLPSNAWEWMAVAQHHGLPTRLLDWSYNPLVAAFFACCSEFETDGVVYCYLGDWVIKPEAATPENLRRISKYRPTAVASRIGRQSGLFTVHPEPEQDMLQAVGNGEQLHLLRITRAYKRQMLFELNHYGINRLNLLGDLDGLSAHMCWTLENRRYWADHDEFMRELLGEPAN